MRKQRLKEKEDKMAEHEKEIKDYRKRREDS